MVVFIVWRPHMVVIAARDTNKEGRIWITVATNRKMTVLQIINSYRIIISYK